MRPLLWCLMTIPQVLSVLGRWPTIEFIYIHRVQPGELDPRDPVIATCHFIPPGECCIPHSDALLGPHENLEGIDYGATAFITLLAGQIGFGWGSPGPNWSDIRCGNGVPILRVPGPTEMPFDPWDDAGGYVTLPPGGNMADEPSTPSKIVFAASWIDLRTRFPPNSADTRYLQWQGVKGLIWGSGRWTDESQGIPFPKRDHTRVVNSWAPHGTVYLQAPTHWRRPDLYRLNGTNYTKAGEGLYEAADGRFLNLTGNTM